jgi:hypothetical protein
MANWPGGGNFHRGMGALVTEKEIVNYGSHALVYKHSQGPMRAR